MIKISLRKNHQYLVYLFISYFLRRIMLIILDETFEFNKSFIFCFCMCIGQITGGFITFIYQCTFLRKKGKNLEKKNSFQLIETKRKMNKIDNYFKILLLIFLASFFDLVEYFITSIFIPKIASLSATANLRLCCIMTITSSFLCVFSLKFKLLKHQKISLIVLSICSFIIIVLEFVYRPKEINFIKYFTSYILLFLHFSFRSYTDVIEKYLGEYNYMNPFIVIMSEGISTFIMSTIYSLFDYPFNEVKKLYNEISKEKFFIFIFLMFFYFVLCAFVNIYKILCNILYSPMTKSLSSYFLNSALIIYHFIVKNDFISEGRRNYFYFFINLLFSLIIELSGLVYNEFFILNFFGLSKETHEEIASRANHQQIELVKKITTFDDEDDNNSEDSDH